MIDLSPFGYTSSESAAYNALLELGPSSGYAVAKALSIARTNAYQALDALAAKGAVAVGGQDPRTYRAIGPTELLALVTREEAGKLDRLEGQVANAAHTAEPTTIRFSGVRRLEELVLRTAARADTVRCLATVEVLRRLVPIWRKRAQDGVPTTLLCVADPPADFPLTVSTLAAPVAPYFSESEPFLLTTSSTAIAGLDTAGELSGIWSTDPLVYGLTAAALDALAASAPNR